MTIALAVFAFTTILGWSYYGERCWQYLFKEKSLVIYRALWVAAALAFANVKVDLVWNLADTLNGLMAVPNLIGLLLLAPMVFKVTRQYFEELGKPLAGLEHFRRLNSRIVGAMVELSPIRAGGREDGSQAVSGVVLAC